MDWSASRSELGTPAGQALSKMNTNSGALTWFTRGRQSAQGIIICSIIMVIVIIIIIIVIIFIFLFNYDYVPLPAVGPWSSPPLLYIHICIYTYSYIYLFIYIYVFICLYMYMIYIYICVYIYIYVYMYIFARQAIEAPIRRRPSQTAAAQYGRRGDTHCSACCFAD